MNKPITVIADDFQRDLINLVNQSNLPMFFVESILKDLLQEVHLVAVRQLEKDRELYNNESAKSQEQARRGD